MQQKHFSSSVQRHGMARHSMKITLAGGTLEMGLGVMSLGWSGWGAERDRGLCTLFALFCSSAREK